MGSESTRLLIRAHPAARRGELGIAGGREPLVLEPLMPSIETPSGAPLGARAAPVWHVARFERDIVDPWEACHALVRNGLGLDSGAIAFAEPDLEQQWTWSSESRAVLGLDGQCGAREPQDGDAYAVGPRDIWFDGDDYSGLARARAAVGPPGDSDRVRIAHLDTGYDAGHRSCPPHVRTGLTRDFTRFPAVPGAAENDGGGPFSNHGHGTATLALLAGRRGDGTPLGGAHDLEVVPLRVARGVVLFRNSAIARALDYVHALADAPDTRIDVVTLSMGGLASAAWADAVNALYERGIVMVASAGNNYGNLPTRFTVYPARFGRVLAACGVMADGRPFADLPLRKMAGCYGPESRQRTAMAAYTPNLPWARIGCPELLDLDGGGTSSAAPQIAAAAALWLQRHRDEIASRYGAADWRRVEAVRRALFASAGAPGDAERARRLGHGTLRAGEALARLPVAPGGLRRQPRDTTGFALLRLLTGLGLRARGGPAARMLELEALQISQRSHDVEALLGEVDPVVAGRRQWDGIDRRRLLEALADFPGVSRTLKQLLGAHLQPATTSAGGRAPAPDGTDVAAAAIAAATGSGSAMTAPEAPRPGQFSPPTPGHRSLRIYAFDPLLGTRLETAHLNEATVAVPWEAGLRPGPVGEYFEVVDIDPPSGSAYAPVDLDHPDLLAQNGLKPSEGLPQFHQQMVYAVAMRTVRHFEQALGRVALWAEREAVEDGRFRFRFVRRLRIYPHALREANAYYDPEKFALLFGYFNAGPNEVGDNLPGGLIFTCLSHDIVAHETCHALLDGIHPYYKEPGNADQWAFHEAFADIVALFQHFTMPEALREAIAGGRGELETADLLGGLAVQFGEALGHRGGLRSAIARRDETGRPVAPDRGDYRRFSEPHARGAVLVAAVFDAFLRIYRRRSRDLLRLATGGTGILPAGAIPHDLANRLADEAAKTARHVLTVCIRALDYCPPVDLTFGDYLRALVTADRDMMPEDPMSYRLAFIEAFRDRGIFPGRVANLSADALTWQTPDVMIGGIAERLQGLSLAWRHDTDRYAAHEEANRAAPALYRKLHVEDGLDDATSRNLLGVILSDSERTVTIEGVRGRISKSRILSVRPVRRMGPDQRILNDIVIAITQRWSPSDDHRSYLGGCSIVYDADAQRVKYVVRKRLGSPDRVARQRDFALRSAERMAARPYLGERQLARRAFALLHRDL